MISGLREWTAPSDTEGETHAGRRAPLLDSFDVDFHLRRSFHVLYELFDALQRRVEPGTAAYSDCRAAMRLVGRIIKTQKLIRDSMVGLRRSALDQVEATASPADTTSPADDAARDGLRRDAVRISNLVRLFLRADAPHWAALGPPLLPSVDLRGLADRWWTSSTAMICRASRAMPVG